MAKRWPDEQEADTRRRCGVSRPLSAKPNACTEHNGVYPTGISVKVPAGVVAQLMEHKPSATAEKHYTARPLDLLRVHHEKTEAWVLEQAGVTFDAKAEPGKLRVVTG